MSEGFFLAIFREITEVLCGTSFSKSLISELAGQLYQFGMNMADIMRLEARRMHRLTSPSGIVA
jgi:hypothetical protein